MRFGSQCEPSVRLVLETCCLYDSMETLSWFCPCVWLTRPHLSPSWRSPRLAASHSSVPSGSDLCRACLILCSCLEGPLVPGFTLRNAGSTGFRGQWTVYCAPIDSGAFWVPNWTRSLSLSGALVVTYMYMQAYHCITYSAEPHEVPFEVLCLLREVILAP